MPPNLCKKNHCQKELQSQPFGVAEDSVVDKEPERLPLEGTQNTVFMRIQSSVLLVMFWEIQKTVHFNFQRAPVSIPISPREGTGRRPMDLGWQHIQWVRSLTSTFITRYKASHPMEKAAGWDHLYLRDKETKAQGYTVKSQSRCVTTAGPEPRSSHLPISSWGPEPHLVGLTLGMPGIRWVLQVRKWAYCPRPLFSPLRIWQGF